MKEERFRSKKEFNNTFRNRKKNGHFNRQIIKHNNNEIRCYQASEIQNRYATVDDYERLYTEDTIQTNKYSSLNRAFLMHPEMDPKKARSVDDYHLNTKKFQRK